MTYRIVQDNKKKKNGALWLVGEDVAHPITEEEVKPIMIACWEWLTTKEKK